jgi:hypothetical protein
MNFFKRKRILLPAFIILTLIAAYAQKIRKEKETVTGYIQGTMMDETSGMAASSINKDIYYIHNDSGDTSRFFAITPEGHLKATYTFKGETTERLGVRDCEDIAVGPGPDTSKSYVYLGDIGDNRAERKYLTVYRFEEPAIGGPDSVKHIDGTPLYIKYPDGEKDAETLMVDPVERLLYIVSKRKNSVSIYTTPLNYRANDTVTLTKRSTIHLGGIPPFKWVTGGDVSKDGSQILLRNYNHVFYWKRSEGVPVWQAMTQKPVKLYYKKEKQGEAVAFDADGKGYYTASEGVGEPIYYYHLK